MLRFRSVKQMRSRSTLLGVIASFAWATFACDGGSDGDPESGASSTTNGGSHAGDSSGDEGTTGGTSTSSSGDSGGSTASSGSDASGPDDVECDPWVQDCADGHKCVPIDGSGDLDFDRTVCRPVDPAGKPAFSPCTMPQGPYAGYDDCDATSFCFHVHTDDNGVCMPICTGYDAAPSCPEGLACYVDGDGTVTICREICDPLAPDCAAPLATCSWDGGIDFLCTGGPGSVGPSDLSPEDQNQAEGSPCTNLDGCAAGLACEDASELQGCSAATCCTPYCDRDAPDGGQSACDPAETCQPFIPSPPAEHAGVGICRLP